MANKKISDLTAVTTPAGTDLLEMEDAGGDSYKITASQVAGLASSPGGTDYDISSANQTADISTLTGLGAGTISRYSWHSGDGSNTFAFTGTAGITIDGIASSEYVGEGVGHLDLFVVSASACITINRGEVWDNDGGNFGTTYFRKELHGGIIQGGLLTMTSGATAITPPVDYGVTPLPKTGGALSTGANAVLLCTLWPTAVNSFTSYVWDTNASTNLTSGSYTWELPGRWSSSYPDASS